MFGPRIPPTRSYHLRAKSDQRDYDCAVFAPHLFAMAIAAVDPTTATRYAVNLGAGDGVSCHDPAWPLFARGYAGLAVEAHDDLALCTNLPAPRVHKQIGTLVRPDNVAAILREAGCPRAPDFLKLDIDGYDGPVLRAVLDAGYRPKVLQVEVQPEIPPPIEFAVLFDAAYRGTDARGRATGFYGASFAYVANAARAHGYFAVQLDFLTPFTHDVTLVDARYRRVIEECFGVRERSDRELYLAQPPGYSHFVADDGIDSTRWRYAEPREVLPAVAEACRAASVAKHGRVLPFHLALDGNAHDGEQP